MIKRLLLLSALSIAPAVIGWSGSEDAGEKPVFFGKLTSQEGHSFNVTNITIGRTKEGGRTVRLYEMPTKSKPTADNKLMIEGNPNQDLTTTELDLLKVKAIEVPDPDKIWIWEKPQSDKRIATTRYEFIELKVTWKGDQTVNYLLELGTENNTKPIKLFCDSVGTMPLSSMKDEKQPMFCIGIAPTELRHKGAPFPAIKKLEIEGHCYTPPKNGNAGMVKDVVPPAA